ncbi:hypothetical protein BHM03_00052191 [Ensete ventricosum]|nr:hypothetical protein BHM03_00052191 [Ensete ventricosum]
MFQEGFLRKRLVGEPRPPRRAKSRGIYVDPNIQESHHQTLLSEGQAGPKPGGTISGRQHRPRLHVYLGHDGGQNFDENVAHLESKEVLSTCLHQHTSILEPVSEWVFLHR